MNKNISLHPVKVPTAPGLEMEGEPGKAARSWQRQGDQASETDRFPGAPGHSLFQVAEGLMVSLPFKTWHKELALLGSRFVAPGQFLAANNSSKQTAGFTLDMLSFLRAGPVCTQPHFSQEKGGGGKQRWDLNSGLQIPESQL